MPPLSYLLPLAAMVLKQNGASGNATPGTIVLTMPYSTVSPWTPGDGRAVVSS